MNLVDSIRQHIPDRPNLKNLITNASLERRIPVLGEPYGATVVIWTERNLTLDGGDGWNGVDATDVKIIQRAVVEAVELDGIGLVHDIVIRQAPATH